MEIQYTKAHISDLERAIQEINDKRRAVTTKKIEYESQLSSLKLKRNPKRTDRDLENTIDTIKARLSEINNEILALNNLKSKKAVLKQDIERGLKSGVFNLSMPILAREIHEIENDANLLRLKQKQEADRIVENYKNNYILDHNIIGGGKPNRIQSAIQDRQSVLEKVTKIKFDLIDPINSSDSYIKINNEINNLTEQITYLKSKL
jgi:hypothetical protein